MSWARTTQAFGGTGFMPLYFFDFSDGELIGRDQFGTKLPDVETAAREAVAALANISKDVRKRHRDRVLGLNVRGQSGETVLNVSLTLEVKWFPDEQIECDDEPGNAVRANPFTDVTCARKLIVSVPGPDFLPHKPRRKFACRGKSPKP